MEIKRIWDILVRRKWVILQGFIVVYGIIAIATFLKPKTYLAEVKALIESEGTQEALLRSMGLEELNQMLSASNISQTASVMEVESAKMLSKSVLDKVAQKLNLRMPDGSYVPGPNLAYAQGTFSWKSLRGLKIKPAKRSAMFFVQGYSPNPQEAQDLANALAEIYIAEDVARKHRETADAARFADEQSKIAKRDWNEAKRKLREFQEQEGVVDISVELQTLITEIADLRAQQNMMDLSLQEIGAMEADLQGQSSMVGGSTISSHSQISNLKADLAAREAALQSDLTKYTDSHPTIIALRGEIIDLQKKLLNEKDLYEKSERVRSQEIQNQLGRYRDQLKNFPEKIYTFAQLELASESSQKLYEMLLDMKYRLNITKAMQISRIQIIEPAWRAKQSSPDVGGNLLIGALMAILLGLGLAILIENLDDSVKDGDSIQIALGLPLLAIIPLISRKTAPLISASPSEGGRRSLYFLREAYNILGHNIKLGCLDEQMRSLMITSSIPGEGKTYVAANLAISMAQSGKNVLLVDTDYPRPDIYRIFNLDNEIGLAEVATGQISIEEALKPSGVDGLWVITTGSKPPNTAQLFDSGQFKEFVKEATRLFDLVIFDTPPLFTLNDPVILGALVNRTLVVAAAGEVSKQMLKQAVSTLERGNNRILGVALNKMRMEGTQYYYYYHSYTQPPQRKLKQLAAAPLALMGLRKKRSSNRHMRPNF
jgi:capsular exopolysaccharide synthesis family protein